MSEIPTFKATEWRRDKGRGWTASVACDRERDRDKHGLIGKVEIDGEIFECVGVERFMPRRPIAKGEVIGLLVREIHEKPESAADEPAAFGGYPTRAIGVMSDGKRVIFGGGGGNVSVGVSSGRPTFFPGDSLGVSSHSDAVAATSMGVSSTPDTHPRQPKP